MRIKERNEINQNHSNARPLLTFNLESLSQAHIIFN